MSQIDSFSVGGKYDDNISLHVDLPVLPETITIDNTLFYKKEEFHVSLVCVGDVLRKRGASPDEVVEKMEIISREFRTYVDTANISLLKILNEFRHVVDEEKQSVVVMCEVENLAAFFDLINTKYGFNFEYQPTHITLYTSNKNKGIYLSDSNDVAELTRIIEAPKGVHF